MRIGTLLGYGEVMSTFKDVAREQKRKADMAAWEVRKANWSKVKADLAREEVTLDFAHELNERLINFIKNPSAVYQHCQACAVRVNCRKETYQRKLNCEEFNS